MKRIDFHHHIVPDVYRAALSKAGSGSVGGVPFPAWKPQDTYARMEQLGISKALLSISAPGVTPIEGADAIDAAKACNDVILEMRAKDQARIGGFSILPLPDMDAALKEYERTRNAGLEGVYLLTNHKGVYLTAPEMEPMLEELNKRKTLVCVHPHLPPGSDKLPMMIDPPVLEFTFDTTRTITDLVLRGTVDKYPDIRWVFSHLGGSIPFLAGRLRLMEDSPRPIFDEFRSRKKRVIDYLRGFYYDCAMAATPANLRHVMETIGADRIVFGSDVPFGPMSIMERNTKNIGQHLNEAQQRSVNFENGEKLLKSA